MLPEGLADDRERLSRFEREAKVLATLNHPNIAQVYGFDEDEGVHFLVMELAEGETLAERIRRGPIPVEEAIPLALQICEALEAAHERGIVHRDLKPANVHVSAETSMAPKVKVLDFGLAKAMAPAAGAVADLTNSPTLTQPTAAGMLMGTASYMSPEQARGQEADARSDIWAFGCVLYEMLTGTRAFQGDNVSDILAAVLKDEPDPDSLPDVPALRHILGRCLEKDLRNRWHHVADVRLELESCDDEAANRSRPSTSLGWMQVALIGAGLLGTVLGGTAVWLAVDDTEVSAKSSKAFRVELDAPLPGNGFTVYGPSVAISPDGTRLAVSGRGPGGARIYVRESDDEAWRELESTENGYWPEFTLDGQHLLYRSSDSPNSDGLRLLQVPFSGGAPLDVNREEKRPFRLNNGWVLVDEGGGMTALDPVRSPSVPERCEEFSALCQAMMETSPFAAMLDQESAVVQLRDDQSRYYLGLVRPNAEATEFLSDAAWPQLVGSRLFFLRGNELWAARVALDGQVGRILNGPLPTGVRVFTQNYEGPPHMSLSDGGALFYLDPVPESRVWLVEPDGRQNRVVSGSEPIPGLRPVHVKASPDGQHVLVTGDRRLRVLSMDGRSSLSVELEHGAWLNNETFAGYRKRGSQLEIRDRQARLLRTVLWAKLSLVKAAGWTLLIAGTARW